MMFLSSGAAIPLEVVSAGVRAFSKFILLTDAVQLLQGLWFGGAWKECWWGACGWEEPLRHERFGGKR